FETAVRLRDAELLRLRARRSLTARRDRDDVDEAEAPNRIDVMNPDEPRADEAHPYTFHMCHGRRQMASRECCPCVRQTLLHFVDRAALPSIFILDIGADRPPLFLQELEHL